MRYCDSDANCTGGQGSYCYYVLLDETGGQIPDSDICTISCNPRSSSGCPSGTGCQIVASWNDSHEAITNCVPSSLNLPGGPCIDDSMCPSGYSCMQGACERYCRIGVATDCTLVGGTCTALGNSPTWGGYVWGTCK